MTFKDFEKYQAEILEQVLKMGDTKGKEYANSESKFANFDRLSVKLKISRLKVAQVYYTKHLDALESYLDNGKSFSTETVHGRIVDLITYLTLVGGMIREDELEIKREEKVIKSEHLWNKADICEYCRYKKNSPEGKLECKA